MLGYIKRALNRIKPACIERKGRHGSDDGDNNRDQKTTSICVCIWLKEEVVEHMKPNLQCHSMTYIESLLCTK